MKRSSNGGRTWSPLQVVYSESTEHNHVTIGNPAPGPQKESKKGREE
jgi:hypothetical protein